MSGPPALSAAATGATGENAPTFARGDAHEGHAAFDHQPWTYRNGFDRLLQRTPLAAWQNPHAQGWQRVKQNARREVWRAHIDRGIYYLKYYRADGWMMRLRALLGHSAWTAEWKSGVYALRAGLAAVSPVGYTTNLHRDGRLCSLLVTEAVEPAYSLDEFWQQIEADEDAGRRRRDTAQMVELLGEMIARAHQAGFEHLDMHAANILVQPVAAGRYRTLFVDLQSARLGVPLSDRAVVRNLAQLNQWFRRHSTIADRMRFLRAYLRWRDEYEPAFAHGRPLRLPFRRLVRALIRAADRHARRLWAQRDRRAQRDGRYFARIRLGGGWRALVVRQTKHPSEESRASRVAADPGWWASQLGDPLHWFTRDGGQSCKDSHSASVRRAVLSHPAGNLPVIVKRPLARDWRRRLSQLLPPSRSMRGWRTGQALCHRNIPVARPLAVLERCLGPLIRDSLLITEAIPGAIDLAGHLHAEHLARPPRDWFRYKRRLCELLARQLRLLEERGFAHRDCKASNILVLKYPRVKLLWIDMDGLRPERRRRVGRCLRALVRLHVSLLNVPGLTRTDRVRFLRSYCARWGADVHAWRTIWQQLTPRVTKKLATLEARRAWKRARYGRE